MYTQICYFLVFFFFTLNLILVRLLTALLVVGWINSVLTHEIKQHEIEIWKHITELSLLDGIIS